MMIPEIIWFVRNFVENGENITEKYRGRNDAGRRAGPGATAPQAVCKLNVIKIIISYEAKRNRAAQESGELSL